MLVIQMYSSKFIIQSNLVQVNDVYKCKDLEQVKRGSYYPVKKGGKISDLSNVKKISFVTEK